jgi:hypothetical protein
MLGLRLAVPDEVLLNIFVLLRYALSQLQLILLNLLTHSLRLESTDCLFFQKRLFLPDQILIALFLCLFQDLSHL